MDVPNLIAYKLDITKCPCQGDEKVPRTTGISNLTISTIINTERMRA